MVKHFTGIALIIVFNAFAGAEEFGYDEILLSDFYGDDTFVSIATGAQQPLRLAPAVASVISAQQLRATGARDLDQALERIPGLHVSRDAIGYNPIYTFRGIYSGFNPQVLMLINNVPITNLYEGDRNQVWGGMPIEAISRIEVIRGPGSALYGADAFAGVINIILKTGSEIKAPEAGIRYGTFDSKDIWIVNGGKSSSLEWMYSIEYSDSNGSDEKISADAQTQLDGIYFTNASLAPGEVNKQFESLEMRTSVIWKNFQLNVGLQQREGQNYVGVAQALDENNVFSSNRWNADITYENDSWFDNWKIKLNGSFFHVTQEVEDDLVLFPPGSTGFSINPLITFPDGVIGNPEVFETHSRFNLSGRYTGFNAHEITLGSGYYYGDIYKTKEEKNYFLTIDQIFGNDIFVIEPLDPEYLNGQLREVSDTSEVFLPEGDRDNYFFLAQDVWGFAKDWELTAGIRYDDYSDFGSTTNPRLALVWSTSRKLTSKLLYGSAFRAPSFAESSISSNPAFFGNPDLDPETLESYELAFDYQVNPKAEMVINFFYYKWQDIIQFVPEGVGIARAQNVGEQKGHGIEFEASWKPLDNLELIGNLAWQKSTDQLTDTDAAHAPEKQVYLQADWSPVEYWHVSLQSNWVIDRNRAFNDNRSEIDDYVVVDFAIRRTNLFSNMDLALLVTNLFDEEVLEPSRSSELGPAIPGDLPLQGRTVLGEVRVKF